MLEMNSRSAGLSSTNNAKMVHVYLRAQFKGVFLHLEVLNSNLYRILCTKSLTILVTSFNCVLCRSFLISNFFWYVNVHFTFYKHFCTFIEIIAEKSG
jgi:hypothetical protein